MSGERETSPPAKFSRYRSVRQRPEPSMSPPSAGEQSQNAAVSRSMSRYRRRPSTKPDPLADIPFPGIPNAQGRADPSHLEHSNTERRVVTEPARRQQPGADQMRGRSPSHRETEAERLQRKAKEHREQKRHNGNPEDTFVKPELKRTPTEAERLAEHKRKDLARLEAELDAAKAQPPRAVSPEKERTGFFSRKRAVSKPTPHAPADSRSKSRSLSRTRSKPSPNPIEPSTKAIEKVAGLPPPGADAPLSAVNAGERRVMIRCKQSSISLPITPETTPIDLIYSAANVMTQNISPTIAILLESYSQLGLERRVRKYERIRDIMNSWDRDTQNYFIVHNSDAPRADTDLDIVGVPREVPSDISVWLHHSQKPGKWNKRHVTLLSNGQIYMAKKAGATMSDKDVVSLCHLSDFDIHIPTVQQIRKTLKPPKKYCHAIKSQQKTAMFLSTENFVHFFSTDDENISERWYAAVQRWRSWYLVNRMGEGKKSKGKTATELSTKVPARSGSKAGPTHKVKVSLDEDPYTIGSFKPLISMDRFGSADPENDSEEENRPRQIPFHLRNNIPSQALPNKRHPPPVSYKVPLEMEKDFASSGLLGRTYSQRQAQMERNAAKDNGFTEGPSLINGPGHQRNRSKSSTTRPETSGDIQRSTSKREPPKPLLDFTPQFKEAPQWDMTGKGRGVPAPNGVPLVDIANTPETGLDDIPKATVFRRETTRPATAAAPAGGREGFVKGGLVSGI